VTLELRDVSVAFPDGDDRRAVLDHLDLTVAPGEIIAVVGASGSGKSTLLTVAGLLRRPQAGEVHIDDRATAGLSNRARTALRRDHVAIIYQSANLLPALIAREQVELVGRIHGLDRRARRDRASALLRDVGLDGRQEQLPAQLSGGERQRVGIARALMADPSVLLADEPTASLDPERAEAVAALIAGEARRRRLATVIVTHDDAPLRHADRVLRLEGGTLRPMPTHVAR
jgi:putative ABC transport system ATP-binding protein